MLIFKKNLTFKIRENFTLSKTEEYGSAIDSEVPTNELGSDDDEANRSDDGEGTSFFITLKISVRKVLKEILLQRC